MPATWLPRSRQRGRVREDANAYTVHLHYMGGQVGCRGGSSQAHRQQGGSCSRHTQTWRRLSTVTRGGRARPQHSTGLKASRSVAAAAGKDLLLPSPHRTPNPPESQKGRGLVPGCVLPHAGPLEGCIGRVHGVRGDWQAQHTARAVDSPEDGPRRVPIIQKDGAAYKKMEGREQWW